VAIVNNKSFVAGVVIFLISCSVQSDVPESIQSFAKDFAANTLSYTEHAEVNESGDYVVTVIVSDKKCTVIVDKPDQDNPNPQRLIVSDISCRPNTNE